MFFCNNNRYICLQLAHEIFFFINYFLYLKNGLEFCCQIGDCNFITFYKIYVASSQVSRTYRLFHPIYFTFGNIISCVSYHNLSSTQWCIFHRVEFFSFAKHFHNILEHRKKVHFLKNVIISTFLLILM